MWDRQGPCPGSAGQAARPRMSYVISLHPSFPVCDGGHSCYLHHSVAGGIKYDHFYAGLSILARRQRPVVINIGSAT